MTFCCSNIYIRQAAYWHIGGAHSATMLQAAGWRHARKAFCFVFVCLVLFLMKCFLKGMHFEVTYLIISSVELHGSTTLAAFIF